MTALPCKSPAIIQWVARYVLPQERHARAALRRMGAHEDDIDDVMQDAYCRIAALTSTNHIERPAAYLIQVAKNLWRDRLRQARVVLFEDFTENAAVLVEDETLGIEDLAIARERLRMVETVLASLPERCRTIFLWKRLEGLSQREIAGRLGVNEHVVENNVQKAVRALLHATRDAESNPPPAQQVRLSVGPIASQSGRPARR